MASRFAQWDGSQDPFGPDVDLAQVLDEISDDVLSGFGAQAALRRLMRRGMRGANGTKLGGLDDLRKRLEKRRRRMARDLNLEGPIADLQDRLNEILQQERAALAEQQSDDARMREGFLDTLPDSPPGALKELMDYRFASPEAQQAFDQLVADLQKQILDAHFKAMSGGLGSMTPEDVARVREMLAALNAMIAARERGDEYDFPAFMDRFGDMFPENPKTLDELLESLARRMAAMSRLLASLSPEQRRQLQELTETLLGDLDLAFQMDQLASELRALAPYLPWGEPVSGFGDEPMPLSDAVGAVEELSDLDELDQALRGDYPGASLDDVDEEKLRRSLGEGAVTNLRHLRSIEKALEEAGIVTRQGGKLEVSPRGARRLGERALVAVFERIHNERPGTHDAPETGGAAEPTGATKPWHFGDTGEIAVQRSVFNAVLRAGPTSSGGRVALIPDDFELVESETRTRTATALLLDLSFSMPLRGHWLPAKRMALALHALIEGKYPQDRLHLIGFSDYARRLQPTDLTARAPLERVYGTNMQHAFLLARRLLAEDPRASKQVIMVTDGEPTAHLVEFGPNREPEAFFSYPPTVETIRATLAEGMRLAASGVTLNVFMLEDSPGLVAFMEKLGRLTAGRVFRMDSQDLGRFILSDYVRRRG
ncbi:MAG TPA: VWA domain-containing protein [Actinomycetota bacterium]|nr:VWA domain-containing protein [Actinomycetota bacterium]